MEELADDVGGGHDAEDDGADDLLPPRQQQHRVLPPAALTPDHVSVYQAHRAVTLLPVTLAIGEVVAVVCRGGEHRNESEEVWVSPCFTFCTWVRHRVLTIWILEDGQGPVAVFFMGELVIIQTLVEFIGADQRRSAGRGICVKDKTRKTFDPSGKTDRCGMRLSGLNLRRAKL